MHKTTEAEKLEVKYKKEIAQINQKFNEFLYSLYKKIDDKDDLQYVIFEMEKNIDYTLIQPCEAKNFTSSMDTSIE